MGVILTITETGGACGDVCCGVGSKEASKSLSGTTAAVQARVGFSSQSGRGHEDDPRICLNEEENEMVSN